jgi:hypothetical protein
VAASSPKSSAERLELVDEYVESLAMSEVLHVLVGNRYVPEAMDSRYAESVFGAPWGDLLSAKQFEPYVEGCAELATTLWPDDEDDDAGEESECGKVTDRAEILAANLLAALAAHPDYLVRRAAWLLEGVAARERKAAA